MRANTALKQSELLEIQTLKPVFSTEELVFSATSDFDAVKQSWRNLEHRSVGHVFQSWAWVSNWHRCIGTTRNVSPLIITATSRDGVLRALFPMGIEARAGLRTLSWLGGEHADYKGPLIDRDLHGTLSDESTRSMFGRAFAMAPGVDAVRLLDMPTQMDGLPNPLLAYRNQLSPVASHQLTLDDNFDALYKARRGSSSRKKLRQKQRRLEAAAGPSIMKLAATPHRRSKAISTLIEQKRARLKEMGVANMFAAPEVRAFYRTLAEQHPEMCQLSTFDAGETSVAANWGLVWGDRYYYVLSTMTDGEHRVQSPGQLHLNELIAWSVERGLKVFDFTAGDESYKDDWCDTSTDLFDVYLGLTIKGRFLSFGQARARSAKRYIKRSDRLWSLAIKLRKLVNEQRAHTA